MHKLCNYAPHSQSQSLRICRQLGDAEQQETPREGEYVEREVKKTRRRRRVEGVEWLLIKDGSVITIAVD